MGIYSDFWEWAFEQLKERGAVDEAAQAGFETAIDACGNEGQVSIIEQMGEDSFQEAAEQAAEGMGGVLDVLLGACPYPEAVSQILVEAAQVIYDILSDELKDAQTELPEDFQQEDAVDDQFGDDDDWI